MRALVPLAMTGLFLAGFALGDHTPLLNAYELVRYSGAAFLPEVGTRFMADQDKLGQAALPVGWALWLLSSALIAWLAAKGWSLLR